MSKSADVIFNVAAICAIAAAVVGIDACATRDAKRSCERRIQAYAACKSDANCKTTVEDYLREANCLRRLAHTSGEK